MSLWNKVEPFCQNLSYQGSFPLLIESGKKGYFSKKFYGVSGYYESKFILIVRGLLKKKEHCSKKVFIAVLIETDSFSAFERVFKRSSYPIETFGKIKESIRLHAELEKEFPDAVVKAPHILGLFVKTIKDRDIIRMDTMEERHPSTLSRNHVIKGKISLADTVQGLYKIAIALDALHKKGFIHGDIKHWNVFVIDSQLKLFDFDLAHVFPIVLFNNYKYEFWDHLSNEIGFRHPFCDVYGWTTILAHAVWGSKFHTILKNRRKDPHLLAYINELYFSRLKDYTNNGPERDFYIAAYYFILNVFVKNVQAFNLAAPYYKTALTAGRKQKEISQGVNNIACVILPTMRNCVEFIRPWVSHLTQAK